MNETVYTEIILSIDVTTSIGKITFNLVKRIRRKEYVEGNAVLAWDRLKNNYEPISAPSMVKLEEQFRESSLKKNQDP